jgi:hypothetical protein
VPIARHLEPRVGGAVPITHHLVPRGGGMVQLACHTLLLAGGAERSTRCKIGVDIKPAQLNSSQHVNTH